MNFVAKMNANTKKKGYSVIKTVTATTKRILFILKCKIKIWYKVLLMWYLYILSSVIISLSLPDNIARICGHSFSFCTTISIFAAALCKLCIQEVTAFYEFTNRINR